MKVLSELIPKIKDYKSKLVLYSYDSFLFDFNMEDGLDYLKKVKNILEQDGIFPYANRQNSMLYSGVLVATSSARGVRILRRSREFGFSCPMTSTLLRGETIAQEPVITEFGAKWHGFMCVQKLIDGG